MKTFLVAQTVKNPPKVQETRVQSLDREDLLEKGVATHSSIFATTRIPPKAALFFRALIEYRQGNLF